jgi:hypothetical protein
MATQNEDVNEDSIEAKLEAAAADTSTTETVDEGTTEEETETEEKGENRIPQGRFNEVNSALKEAREAQEATVTQLAESNEKLVRMAELLEAKDNDVQTLNEIKSYINDPEMKPHVEAIDAKLRGIEQEVETGETTPEDALSKTHKLLEQTRVEMADAQATAQAESLVTKADIIADKLLAQLPEEYNEEDRNVITDLFTEKMDWDAAVADPDNLSTILTKRFQETIDRYGTPRGSLISTEKAEELTTEAETAQTPEQELEAVMKQPWGATKETELGDGRVRVDAELSDDEFNAAMAKIIRVSSGR